MKQNKGLLIIISGPSGVGKSTIRSRLVNENNNFWYSISMTTRKPRIIEKTKKMEEHGKDYYFVSVEEFNKNIENDNFIEYAEVYDGLYYGTPKDKVFEMLNNGYNVILEIDVQGAIIIKSKFKEAILIFIKPPTLEELEKRLRNRNSDSENIIIERLKKAEYEISFINEYDHIIESGSKEHDYNEVLDIINQEQRKRC